MPAVPRCTEVIIRCSIVISQLDTRQRITGTMQSERRSAVVGIDSLEIHSPTESESSDCDL